MKDTLQSQQGSLTNTNNIRNIAKYSISGSTPAPIETTTTSTPRLFKSTAQNAIQSRSRRSHLLPVDQRRSVPARLGIMSKSRRVRGSTRFGGCLSLGGCSTGIQGSCGPKRSMDSRVSSTGQRQKGRCTPRRNSTRLEPTANTKIPVRPVVHRLSRT